MTTRPGLDARIREIRAIDDLEKRLEAIDTFRGELRDRVAIERRAAIEDARSSGLTYADIGAKLGVSPQRVHQLATYEPNRSTP